MARKPAKTQKPQKQAKVAGQAKAKKVETIKALEQRVQRLQLQLQSNLLEANIEWADNFVDPREPLFDTDEFWLPLGYQEQVPWNLNNRLRGEVLPVYLSELGLKVIRDTSRRICSQNEFAINALENRISYIVGSGLVYKVSKVRDCPDSWVDLAQRIIDDHVEANDWGEIEAEIVRRWDRDGEAFLRWFPQYGGELACRFVEPEHVKSPHGGSMDRKYSFGVETEPRDVEKVNAYWIVEDPDNDAATERVPATEIQHFRANVDRTAKRGVPTFYPVRKNFDRADKLLRNMSLMAQIQATYALIRKYKGYSAAQVAAASAADVDWTITSAATGRAKNFRQLEAGSIVDVPEGVEYEFPSGNVNAASYIQILQAELRAIASRLVMPEFMLTADASNANYSSTMIAESPAVRNFERIQKYFRRKMGAGRYHRRETRNLPAMWRVLRQAVRAGLLPTQALFCLEIQVEGPSLVVRDQLQETQKNQILSGSKVLSRQTWSIREKLDYDQEQQNIEEDNERTGGQPATLPMPGEDGGTDRGFPRLAGGPMREGRDSSGHDHGNDGRFASKGGKSGPSASPADRHAKGILAKARDRVKGAAKKVVAKAVGKIQEQYRGLEKDLGKKAAIAVMAASVAMLPSPVPGSSLAPIAAAKAYVAIRNRFKPAKTEATETPINMRKAVLAAQQFITSTYKAAGEKPPTIAPGKLMKSIQAHL